MPSLCEDCFNVVPMSGRLHLILCTADAKGRQGWSQCNVKPTNALQWAAIFFKMVMLNALQWADADADARWALLLQSTFSSSHKTTHSPSQQMLLRKVFKCSRIMWHFSNVQLCALHCNFLLGIRRETISSQEVFGIIFISLTDQKMCSASCWLVLTENGVFVCAHSIHVSLFGFFHSHCRELKC